MKEREVNLMDLVIHIMLHWRSIILMMLIGGILLGILSYAKSAYDVKVQNAENKIKATKINETPRVIEEWLQNKDRDLETMLKEELTDGELSDIYYAIYYENECHLQEQYQKESILMQIDPNNTQRAEITFQVQSDSLEKSYNLEKVYEDMVNSVDFNDELAKILDKPAYAVTDIWTLSRGSSGMLMGCDSFKIVIYHYDRNMCQKIANSVIEYINEKHDKIMKKVGEHEIVVLNQSVGALKSDGILLQQKNFKENILRLKAEAIDYKRKFTEEEWYYYNLVKNGTVAGNPGKEEVLPMEVTGIARVEFKSIASGVIIFSLIYILALMVCYILDDKLRATDQMDKLFDIPQFGQIPSNETQTRKFAFVDKYIYALQYKNRNRCTYEEAIDFVTVLIKITTRKSGISKISLIGCNLHENTMNVCNHIKKSLSKDLEIQIIDNVLYKVDEMRKLEFIEAAILLEKAAYTSCNEIAKEIEFLRKQQIKIIGGIIVE